MIQLQSYRRQRKLYFKGHLGLQNCFITGFVPGIFVVFVLQAEPPVTPFRLTNALILHCAFLEGVFCKNLNHRIAEKIKAISLTQDHLRHGALHASDRQKLSSSRLMTSVTILWYFRRFWLQYFLQTKPRNFWLLGYLEKWHSLGNFVKSWATYYSNIRSHCRRYKIWFLPQTLSCISFVYTIEIVVFT